MIPNEQIAHELTMIYLSNRYGVENTWEQEDGYVYPFSKHFHDTNEPHYKRVGTGEKGFLGFEKTNRVQDGYKTDKLFAEILRNYKTAYQRFLTLLETK